MESETNKYRYSKAYFKILDLIQNNPQEDVFVICGGQGAGKTITILQLIIQALLSECQEATVLSSELSKMKKTVVRDYKKICKDWGVIKDESEFNKSESKHEYSNDSYIDFLGADVTDLGKGFRRDILYINEADKLNIESAVQFISRAGLTIIDYNPDRMFWGYDYINDNNFITLTFEDNEFLSESEVKSILEYRQRGFKNPELPIDKLFEDENILHKYWANKWRVYGCGLVGQLDGVVWSNWKQIDEIPTNAKLICYGLDFGFSNSYTAVVAIYKLDNQYYFDEIMYERGKVNSEIAETIKKHPTYSNSVLIYCDYAEPKSIEDLRRAGLRATACESKTDIRTFAIDKLNQDVFFVTKRSTNIIQNINGYIWDTDRDGNALNKPKKVNDHCPDAMIYGVGSEGKYDGRY